MRKVTLEGSFYIFPRFAIKASEPVEFEVFLPYNKADILGCRLIDVVKDGFSLLVFVQIDISADDDANWNTIYKRLKPQMNLGQNSTINTSHWVNLTVEESR